MTPLTRHPHLHSHLSLSAMLTIARYGRRNWAVYLNGDLLVVAVYKKGAAAVKSTLESALALAGNAIVTTPTQTASAAAAA
jgi:hypothetical protein